MEPNCVFCKIVAGELPAERLDEDDAIVAFPDIRPKAPVHILVVPKVHLASLTDVRADQTDLLGRLLQAARRVAEAAGLSENGYKLVMNVGRDGGQVVPHLHLHILGGKSVAGVT